MPKAAGGLRCANGKARWVAANAVNPILYLSGERFGA